MIAVGTLLLQTYTCPCVMNFTSNEIIMIKLKWKNYQFSHIFQTVEEQPGFVTGDPSFPIKRENGK